jgi:hypothetical protein
MKDEFSIYVTSYVTEASSAVRETGEIESYVVLMLDGLTTQDGQAPDDRESRAVSTLAIFADPPPDGLGRIQPDSGPVLFLRHADLPGWLAALSELPAELDLLLDGQVVQEAHIYRSDAAGRRRTGAEIRDLRRP